VTVGFVLYFFLLLLHLSKTWNSGEEKAKSSSSHWKRGEMLCIFPMPLNGIKCRKREKGGKKNFSILMRNSTSLKIFIIKFFINDWFYIHFKLNQIVRHC